MPNEIFYEILCFCINMNDFILLIIISSWSYPQSKYDFLTSFYKYSELKSFSLMNRIGVIGKSLNYFESFVLSS